MAGKGSFSASCLFDFSLSSHMANGPLSPHLAQSTVQQSAGQKVLWDNNERTMRKGLKGWES